MKVLHLLAAGDIGGIEVLCKDILQKADWDNRIAFLFEEGEIYQELKSKKYNVFSLKHEKRNKRKIVDTLKEYCEKESIDVITVHHGGLSCNLIYIMLQKEMPQIKYVRYLHGSFDKYTYGNSNNVIKNYIIKKVMQKAFDISDLLIFISEAVKESFEINFKINRSKKMVIYNGINKKFFDNVMDKKNKTNTTTNIVYVGRLAKEKGIHILINACNIINKRNIKFNLTIVGDGTERKNLEKQINDNQLKKIVTMVGKQTNVIQWLDKADIFIYPSICEEGFGISVAEAMSRGCIPITFNKGGLPEIIENNVNGFIINEMSDEMLSRKIEEIINMKDKTEIIQRAIETSKKFTITNTIDKLQYAYNELLQ